ncbi:excalibur calcium-binding domain-containing protein [Mycolicibacterium sp. XJ1819]
MFRILLAAVGLAAVVAVGAAPVAEAAPYQNCKAAAADGRYNIPSDDPAYGPHLDRDDDGIGCER